MESSDEIVLCSLSYHHQELSGTCVNNTQVERILLIKNNKIYVETTHNCNAKVRHDILHIDFEIDKNYIENLKTLLFGVLNRNEANKRTYGQRYPTPQCPSIWIKENIVDFVTPIKLYNELYLLQKEMHEQLIKKDTEIYALKKNLEEKDELIKQNSSTFSLDKLVNYQDEDYGDNEFIEATWP